MTAPKESLVAGALLPQPHQRVIHYQEHFFAAGAFYVEEVVKVFLPAVFGFVRPAADGALQDHAVFVVFILDDFGGVRQYVVLIRLPLFVWF